MPPKKPENTLPPKKAATPLPPWNLPTEILQAAADGDESTLADLLAKEGLGGRPQAKLLILAVPAWAKYKPMAADLPRLEEEQGKVGRLLAALKRFMPEAVSEVAEHAETLHKTTRDSMALLNAVGEAKRAGNFCVFMQESFDIDATSRASALFRSTAACPHELRNWYRKYSVQTHEDGPNAWVLAQPIQAPVTIVMRPAGINTPHAEED